jgi:hypothetical protein
MFLQGQLWIFKYMDAINLLLASSIFYYCSKKNAFQWSKLNSNNLIY